MFGVSGKALNQVKIEDIPSIRSYQAVKFNDYSGSDSLKDLIVLLLKVMKMLVMF